jgi:hypothetical protein
MIHYVRPLVEGIDLERPEQARYIISVGEACWAAASDERRGGSADMRKKVIPTLTKAGIMGAADFLQKMVERHQEMFPFFEIDQGGDRFREKVLPATDPWIPFDESLTEPNPPDEKPNEMDEVARQALARLDKGPPQPESEVFRKAFYQTRDALQAGFFPWVRKRISWTDGAVGATRVIRFYTVHLYQVRTIPLNRFPEKALPEFLSIWLFRNANIPATQMSTAPAALTFFGAYLDFIGHTEGLASRMEEALAPLRPDFEKTLLAYFGPPHSADSPLPGSAEERP